MWPFKKKPKCEHDDHIYRTYKSFEMDGPYDLGYFTTVVVWVCSKCRRERHKNFGKQTPEEIKRYLIITGQFEGGEDVSLTPPV